MPWIRPLMITPALAGLLVGWLLTAQPAYAQGWWPFGGDSKGSGAAAATASTAPATPSAAATDSVEPPSAEDAARLHVVDIDIRGNKAIPEEQVLLSIPIHRGEDISRKQVLDALQRIYGLGYFQDAKASTEPVPGGERLVFNVVENPKLERVDISGMTVFDKDEIKRLFKPLEGQTVNLREVQKIVKDLEKRYADRGLVLARVVDLQVRPLGVLELKIAEGQVEAIKIVGNEETRDYVIRREITLKPGDLFNFKKMEDDLRRIYNLNFFEDIGLKYEPGSSVDKVVVVINVKEKQTGMFQLSAGYSNRDGPLGIVSLRKDNLLGRGQSVSADLTVSRNPSAELSYFNPWIDTEHTSLGLSLYSRRYANFLNQRPLPGGPPSLYSQETRTGSVLSVGRPLLGDAVTSSLRGTVSIKGEQIGVARESQAGSGVFIGVPGDTVSGRTVVGSDGKPTSTFDYGFSLGTSFTQDTRDLVINPSSGWFNTLSVEQYLGGIPLPGNWSIGDLDLTRINFDANRYIPVWPAKTVLAIGAKVGTTLSLFRKTIPSYERFYSTGAYLVRGWSEALPGFSSSDSVLYQGDSLALGSVEYRFPIWNIVSGVVFADTGIFWDQQSTPTGPNAFNRLHLRSGYGIGVRVNTPLGPLRLDLGVHDLSLGTWGKADFWPTEHPKSPGVFPSIVPHFSIGQKF